MTAMVIAAMTMALTGAATATATTVATTAVDSSVSALELEGADGTTSHQSLVVAFIPRVQATTNVISGPGDLGR